MTVAVAANPSLALHRFLFSTGSVDPNTGLAGYYQDNTAIPGALSQNWFVLQWQRQESATQPEYLNPANANMSTNGDYDPLYGSSVYTVTCADQSGRFSVFNNNGSYVYDVRESISPATAAATSAYGSPDLGLQTRPGLMGGAAITMNHALTLSLDARIREADVSYAPGMANQPFAATNPLGSAGMGVVVTYDSPKFHVILFLQAELADSRFNTTPIAYQNTSFSGSTATVIYNDINASGAELPYVTGNTPEHITWNINAMLQDAIRGVAVLSADAAQLNNLSAWHFNSTYVGLEMGGINAPTIGGSATLDMQLSNLNLQYDPTKTYSAATAPNGGSALISASYGDAPKIQFTDNTSGLSGTTYGEQYTGPVAGITSEYIYEGTDSMTFIAPENSYIVGGAGDDQITATAGNNILDGGSGSNWLTGGSGNDTFFMSGLSGQSVWDSITNFHPGDMATIWGDLTNVQWTDNPAVSGHDGLTLLATGSAGQSVSMTFAGMTMADLSHFGISSGHVGGNADMLIGNF